MEYFPRLLTLHPDRGYSQQQPLLYPLLLVSLPGMSVPQQTKPTSNLPMYDQSSHPIARNYPISRSEHSSLVADTVSTSSSVTLGHESNCNLPKRKLHEIESDPYGYDSPWSDTSSERPSLGHQSKKQNIGTNTNFYSHTDCPMNENPWVSFNSRFMAYQRNTPWAPDNKYQYRPSRYVLQKLPTQANTRLTIYERGYLSVFSWISQGRVSAWAAIASERFPWNLELSRNP